MLRRHETHHHPQYHHQHHHHQQQQQHDGGGAAREKEDGHEESIVAMHQENGRANVACPHCRQPTPSVEALIPYDELGAVHLVHPIATHTECAAHTCAAPTRSPLTHTHGHVCGGSGGTHTAQQRSTPRRSQHGGSWMSQWAANRSNVVTWSLFWLLLVNMGLVVLWTGGLPEGRRLSSGRGGGDGSLSPYSPLTSGLTHLVPTPKREAGYSGHHPQQRRREKQPGVQREGKQRHGGGGGVDAGRSGGRDSEHDDGLLTSVEDDGGGGGGGGGKETGTDTAGADSGSMDSQTNPGATVVDKGTTGSKQNLRGSGERGVQQQQQQRQQQHVAGGDGEAAGLTHLIMVAGHAVTVKESLDGVEKDDAVWYLLPYQRNQDLPGAFVEHIRQGVEAAANDTHALLIFSGGQTRADAGPKSEAVSYFAVADHFKWWGHGTSSDVKDRTLAEEYARDSFENLMFSVCRFKEYTGDYPKAITVVSFDFKRQRYVSQHRAALQFPASAFSYIGIDPQGPNFNKEDAEKGEYENAVRQFEQDPYGCHSDVLQKKRRDRNPFHRTSPYAMACPEMADLLAYCGRTVYAGQLPWTSV